MLRAGRTGARKDGSWTYFESSASALMVHLTFMSAYRGALAVPVCLWIAGRSSRAEVGGEGGDTTTRAGPRTSRLLEGPYVASVAGVDLTRGKQYKVPCDDATNAAAVRKNVRLHDCSCCKVSTVTVGTC